MRHAVNNWLVGSGETERVGLAARQLVIDIQGSDKNKSSQDERDLQKL